MVSQARSRQGGDSEGEPAGRPGCRPQGSPPAELLQGAKRFWAQEALPALEQFIRIPCLSPDYDADWEEHGHILAAAKMIKDWAENLALEGATIQILQIPGLTPLVVADVPACPAGQSAHAGTSAAVDGGKHPGPSRPTLLYGHLDKQPPVGEWRIGAGPYTATRKGDRLYGRGASDDGYAAFAALGALHVLRKYRIGHGRCVVIVEASEESTSAHLAPYLNDQRLLSVLGPAGPALVIGLDSGCPTYDRLWVTTSLRGHLVAALRVDVLQKGVHSGDWGGLIPSSFRLLRQLLSRIEDERSGRILVRECYSEIPSYRLDQIEDLVQQHGSGAIGDIPRLPGLPEKKVNSNADLMRQIRAQTWEPSLAITGIDGIPTVKDGGSLIRPFTAAKLSIRLSPSVDPRSAGERLRSVLLADPPDTARVTFEIQNLGAGFDAPPIDDWLEQAATDASRQYFGEPAGAIGQGGTNPFLSMMRATFPGAQFLATGLLGPDSNAHAPDEMLHVPTAERLTACIAHVLSQAP
jgi:acetylornithine deacetylase/succinyl-diaminopimelate desuccinylase-like protein